MLPARHHGPPWARQGLAGGTDGPRPSAGRGGLRGGFHVVLGHAHSPGLGSFPGQTLGPGPLHGWCIQSRPATRQGRRPHAWARSQGTEDLGTPKVMTDRQHNRVIIAVSGILGLIAVVIMIILILTGKSFQQAAMTVAVSYLIAALLVALILAVLAWAMKP